MTVTTVDEEIRDFSVSQKTLSFRVDDDVFQARGVISAHRLMEIGSLGKRAEDADEGAVLGILVEMFRMVLVGSSVERFVERLSSDDEPIGIRQAHEISQWIMECYAERPTEPSGD